MLLDRIKSDLVSAQKDKDQLRVDALRFLLGAIHDLEIQKYPPSAGGSLTEEDVLAVIVRQAKTHKESIEMFRKGDRHELVEKESRELEILQGYLPEQMGSEEVRSELSKIVRENKGADYGTLMKIAMAHFKGKADGAVVSGILKELMAS